MRILITLLAAIIAAAGMTVSFFRADAAENVDGKWIEVRRAENELPPALLEFKRGTLHFTNLFSSEATVPYMIRIDGARTIISFEFSYQVRRGNGRIVRRNDKREFLLHEQIVDGRTIPVLSESAFEMDGRGEIILAEYLHEDDLKKLGPDFRSDLCRRLNDRKAPPSYIEMPSEHRISPSRKTDNPIN